MVPFRPYLQLPAVCLSLAGLYNSIALGRGSILACFYIPFIPFFLLDFFNAVIVFCSSQALSKGLKKVNLLSPFGANDKAQILAIDESRIFCGSVIQLILQVTLHFETYVFFSWLSLLAILHGGAAAVFSQSPSSPVFSAL